MCQNASMTVQARKLQKFQKISGKMNWFHFKKLLTPRNNGGGKISKKYGQKLERKKRGKKPRRVQKLKCGAQKMEGTVGETHLIIEPVGGRQLSKEGGEWLISTRPGSRGSWELLGVGTQKQGVKKGKYKVWGVSGDPSTQPPLNPQPLLHSDRTTRPE